MKHIAMWTFLAVISPTILDSCAIILDIAHYTVDSLKK